MTGLANRLTPDEVSAVQIALERSACHDQVGGYPVESQRRDAMVAVSELRPAADLMPAGSRRISWLAAEAHRTIADGKVRAARIGSSDVDKAIDGVIDRLNDYLAGRSPLTFGALVVAAKQLKAASLAAVA